MESIPGGFGRELSDLHDGDTDQQTEEIEMVRYFCFGPCNDGGSGNSGNSDDNSSGNSALELHLGGDAVNSNGTFSGGIEQMLLYETADGKKSFSITDFSLELNEMAYLNANLLFETSNEGTRLLASGLAEFSDISAGLVGGFSTMEGELSFGLFAAFSMEDRELPIIPGVLAVSGFGGGFFYRPQEYHLNPVYALADNIRGAPPAGIDRTITANNRPADQLNPESGSDLDLRFSMMLAADLNMFGILDGSTFFELTDGYIALDADGVVLGMESSPALTAGFFLGVGYSEDLNIQVRLQAFAEFDPIIEADGDVQFFAARTGEGDDRTTEWGFIGEISADILTFFDGYSTIMASNDGFMIDVELSAGIDRTLLTLKGYLRGSLWNLRYDDAEIPFGAYGIAGGEIDILSLLSGEAELQAALVRRDALAGQTSGRYEMFAYGSYSASAFKVISSSGSAWFKITTNPIEVDAGRGEPDFDDNTIAQAQAQADEFRGMIESAMDELAAELGTVTVPGLDLDEEDVARAGYHYWTADDLTRALWRHVIYSNETEHRELFGGSLPSAFYNYLDIDYYREDTQFGTGSSIRTDEQLEEMWDQYSWTAAEEELGEKIEFVEQITEQTVNRLEEIVVRAIEFEYIADDLRQSITEVMATSPANVINQPEQNTIGAGNTPVFHVDGDLAAQQSQTSADFSEALEEMEGQVHAVVDSIEHNIRELENMMGAQYMPVITGITPGEFTRIEVDYTEAAPSINAVSEHYKRTLEAVDRYYSLLANKYWHRMNVASLMQMSVGVLNYGVISDMVDGIINDIEQAYIDIVQSAYQEIDDATTVIQRSQLQSQLPEKLEKIEPYALHMAERQRILEDLIDSPNVDGWPYHFEGYRAESLSDSLKVPNVLFDGLRDDTYNLHIGMHTLGLQKYIDHKTEFILDEFIADHQAYRQNLLDIMEDHTARIDDFYNLKANMYGSLYSIIDDYVEIRRAAEQQDDTGPIPGLLSGPQIANFLADDSDDVELDVLTQFEIRREEILQTLQPPDILDIRASTDRGVHYFGTSQIEWDIEHPVGISEISALVTEYGSGEEPSGQVNQPLSIGTAEQIHHYSYLQADQPEYALAYGEGENDPEATTRKVDFELRARGMGGISSTRQVTFDVPVGEGGNSTSFSDNILPEITTPPTDVMVDLDTNYNRAHSVIRWMEFDPVTFKTTPVDIDVERYWTSDPANIQVRTLVEENISSIRGYEYSVGSSIGGQDILGTTNLIGRTERYPDEPGNWTDLIEATTRIINMNPGDTHYVTVEAFNIGDLSIREEVPIAVVYDDTPPTMPQPLYQFILPPGSLSFIPFGQTPIEAEPFVTLPPQYRLSNAVQENRMSTNVTPSLGTISWEPSEDYLSGVSHYEYLISTSEGYTNTHFIQKGFTTKETEIEITSGDSRHDNHTFEFDQYKYVHIRAVNNAGLASDVYTVSGFPVDPNPPTKPVIAGYNGTDHIRIYLKERSYDAESGIMGYRYSIGSTPGGTDIRGWPDDGVIDFEENTEETISGTAPYLQIPKEDFPKGQEFYVNIKGVNGQGRESSVVSTGAVILDSTPPAEPVISLDVLSDGNQLKITVDNIHDDISGVAGVYATVLPDDFPYHLATPSWENIGNISGVRHDNFSLTVTYDVPEEVSVYDLNVTVRVQNAAGLETTVTESVPAPVIPSYYPSTLQRFTF
jgi:large repetitive protein